MQQPPERLYKYRKFDDRTLNMLIVDELYFTDPSKFNDPLDTKPSLNANLPVPLLEQTLFQLVEERIKSEMKAAAKSIEYRGTKAVEHIHKLSRTGAIQLIEEVRDHADNPAHDDENPLPWLLENYIGEELLRRYEAGVFSLAERSDCPLMWSHYGDQHNGICTGYSIPLEARKNLHKISYGGSRVVNASDVAAMLDGDEQSRQRVDDSVLLKKANDWQYEKEWRLIDRRGSHNSTLELEEIVFGMRCTTPVRFAVVKALAGRDRDVKFFEICERPGTFILEKIELDLDDLGAQLPRRCRSAFDHFQNVDII